jgi:hypothetical protein
MSTNLLCSLLFQGESASTITIHLAIMAAGFPRVRSITNLAIAFELLVRLLGEECVPCGLIAPRKLL